MTGTLLGTVTVAAGAGAPAVWERVHTLAAAGGLPPLAAARLAQAAVELIGRPGTGAVVEVTAVSDNDGARVEAVVYGGSGRCDGPASRLADACRPCTTASGAAGHMAAVAVPRQPADHPAGPSWQLALGQAAERGGLAAVLSAALIALDDQAGLAVDYSNELSQLRAELEATSQGLMAMHAELSDQRDQLQKAHRAADQASHAKAAFLSSMSHEIRSPLNAMIGFTTLLRETALTPEQAEYADTLATAGSHLRDLVNGILDLSKVESGQLELEEVPFDLAGCAEDAAAIVAPQAEDKQLALATLFAPGVPSVVTGDPLRLRQILVNLLSNAVKFTERGEVTIEVAARPGNGQGECRLVFEVRDTGPGIPATVLGRLFEPFTQAEAATTRWFGGTGLGLAISKQLTERMGGMLTVASRPGEGATFTATIPLRQPVPDGQTEQPDEPLTGRHVLLVHPHPTIAEAARRHLAAWGAAVTIVSSAAEAASRSSEWADAALAVVGASQPGDLPGAIRTVTAAHSGRPLPIVALTPLTPGPGASLTAAAATVAAAPIRRARLHEAVLSALGRTGPASGARQPAPPARAARALRVLVADDDPANQRATALLLRMLGHHADVAGDGEEAAAVVTRGGYDLVLMDVNMPRLDGIAATRQIRAQHPGQHPPIVALTASATAGTRQACLQAGMNGFITKPIQLADLTDLITRLDGIAVSRGGFSPGPMPPSGTTQPASSPTARTVLYIDDNPMLRSLVERILAQDPTVTVLTAADGQAGLELAATHRPDLILLDLNLAGTPGETLLKDLRAHQPTSTIPVVVVSGDTRPQTVKRLASLGATAHLPKPFNAEQLRATVAAIKAPSVSQGPA
jgi:signal transduction histidine kinase/CheY-like chemotaxis protein